MKESFSKKIKASNNTPIRFKLDKEKVRPVMPLNKWTELEFMRVR